MALQEGAGLLEAAKGKTIERLRIDNEYNLWDGGLLMRFTDGSGVWIYDDQRSCCETRYMHTDDVLSSFEGASFVGVRLGEYTTSETEGGEESEVQFLIIDTSLGSAVVETHNIHNGYYGGFWIKVAEMEQHGTE